MCYKCAACDIHSAVSQFGMEIRNLSSLPQMFEVAYIQQKREKNRLITEHSYIYSFYSFHPDMAGLHILTAQFAWNTYNPTCTQRDYHIWHGIFTLSNLILRFCCSHWRLAVKTLFRLDEMRVASFQHLSKHKHRTPGRKCLCMTCVYVCVWAYVGHQAPLNLEFSSRVHVCYCQHGPNEICP